MDAVEIGKQANRSADEIISEQLPPSVEASLITSEHIPVTERVSTHEEPQNVYEEPASTQEHVLSTEEHVVPAEEAHKNAEEPVVVEEQVAAAEEAQQKVEEPVLAEEQAAPVGEEAPRTEELKKIAEELGAPAEEQVSPTEEARKRSEKKVTFAASGLYNNTSYLTNSVSFARSDADELPAKSAEELTPEDVWSIIKNVVLKPLVVGLLMGAGHLAVISVLKHKLAKSS